MIPHREPAAAVVAELGSDAANGLGAAEAARRLHRYGLNRLKSAPDKPWWRHLLEQFANFLVIILLIATLISAVEWLLADPRATALPYEAIVILAIVMLNALLGFIQESRAERSVRALMALAAPESTLVRDGRRQRSPAHEIVPGDILLVEAGDRIPADARLIDDANLQVDEAALTGESVPVAKDAQPIDADVGLADRTNMLFSGTVATYGRGRAVVVATGVATEVGRIAGLLETAHKEATPLQQELDRTGKRLTVIMLGICAIVLATGLVTSPVINLSVVLSVFLFAVALAVAAIPEALPAIVTIGLSLGVRRMAAANAIVRKLPAVETLGAATVICTDKTGTLTRNEMTVRAIYTSGGHVEVGGSGYIPEGAFIVRGVPLAAAPEVDVAVKKTLRAAMLANDATLTHSDDRWVIQGDPTEGALVVAGRKYGLTETELARFPRVAEIPFTSERKRHTTLHIDRENAADLHVFVKGAPDVLLGKCRFVWEGGEAHPLGEDRRGEIADRNNALAAEALRTLAIATRRVPASSLGLDVHALRADRTREIDLPAAIEDDLVLLGLVGMIDPPRPEAKAAVALAKQAHIRTVMITGDHPATAQAIARELAILEPGSRLVTGSELRGMDAAALDAIVDEVRVFARVDPDHKLRIVESLQRQGHVVAMTGDGINDAPALKAANIGVAMGITGTDVAKEAADMVLADDNFASIVRAVEEGRGIFDNIRKYLIYLLSSNAGELMTMFAGVMLAPLLGLASAQGGLFLPLLAAHLLWINLITDGPPALALGIEPNEPDVMARPPRKQGVGVIATTDWLRIAGVGSVMMAGTLAVLDAYYPGGLFTLLARNSGANAVDEAYARTMAFTTLMMFQLYNVFNCRSTRRSVFDGFFVNRWLVGAVALSLAAQVLVIHVPVLQAAFHTVPLTAGDWLIAAAAGATLLVPVEIAKLTLRARERRRGARQIDPAATRAPTSALG